MKFIIDTNVLLDYPKILEERDNCVITLSVLKEIDKLKRSPNEELRFNCRRASHVISQYKDKIEFILTQKDNMTTDDEIIYYARRNAFGIVSNDLNLLIVAEKEGISVESYRSVGSNYTGIRTLKVHFEDDNYTPILDKIMLDRIPLDDMRENEYLIIQDECTEDIYCTLHCVGNRLEIVPPVDTIDNMWSGLITPRNPEQTCLFDLLSNPDITILLAQGKYGSGKSLCLTSYALQQLENGEIDKIVWVPNNAFNDNSREVAALPGGLYEKELPFLGTLIDIMGEIEVVRLLEEGKLEIVPISIMRGRNFKNSIVLVNEAQNLTQDHIKLLVGRIADGTRIFFDGDVKQVDSYIFKNKNGLQLLLKLADSNIYSKLFGVATLNTIERSLTASASDYLDSIL